VISVDAHAPFCLVKPSDWPAVAIAAYPHRPLWGLGRQQHTRGDVAQVVVTAGSVVDAVAPAARGAAFQASELIEQAGMIEQIDALCSTAVVALPFMETEHSSPT